MNKELLFLISYYRNLFCYSSLFRHAFIKSFSHRNFPFSSEEKRDKPGDWKKSTVPTQRFYFLELEFIILKNFTLFFFFLRLFNNWQIIKIYPFLSIILINIKGKRQKKLPFKGMSSALFIRILPLLLEDLFYEQIKVEIATK